MVQATTVPSFQLLSISRDSLPSLAELETDEQWYRIQADDLQYRSEKQFLHNIKTLVGAAHFDSPKMLLFDTVNFSVYGGRLETVVDANGDRNLVVTFGENKIPVTFADGKLFIGDCPAKTSVSSVKKKVDGASVDSRLLVVEISRLIEGNLLTLFPDDPQTSKILKLVIRVLMHEDADADYVQALLDSGNFAACAAADEKGVSLIEVHKRGGGGLYPSLGDLAKTLHKSNVKVFPRLLLPIIGFDFHEVSGVGDDGEPYTIRTVKVAIDSAYMPSEMLISWGKGKGKTQYRLENPRGFEISGGSGIYDMPIYQGMWVLNELLHDRPLPPSKANLQEYAEKLLLAYNKGTLGLTLTGWHKTHPSASPVTKLHPGISDGSADWSGINIASVPMLPGKGQSTSSTEFSAPQLPPASEPEALPVDFEPVTVEAVTEKVKTRKASPV